MDININNLQLTVLNQRNSNKYPLASSNEMYTGYVNSQYTDTFLWFQHILFKRKGLGVAYSATLPYPEILSFQQI